MYKGTRDQPMPGPFPAPPFFKGKATGTRFVYVPQGRRITTPHNGTCTSYALNLTKTESV